jgi:hypothetical protein
MYISNKHRQLLRDETETNYIVMPKILVWQKITCNKNTSPRAKVFRSADWEGEIFVSLKIDHLGYQIILIRE